MDEKTRDKLLRDTGVLWIIDEPTWVEDIDGLIASYADRLAIKDVQGIKFDIRRIKDKRYFVKKAYQIISNPNRPWDSNSFQWRVLLVQCLENLMKTQFKNTRDFKQKVKKYLKNYEIRKQPVGDRIKKARKKLGLSQKQAADLLGFKSHVTIVNYEKGKRYPPTKVFRWLEEVGV